jgi:hypothetical protein
MMAYEIADQISQDKLSPPQTQPLLPTKNTLVKPVIATEIPVLTHLVPESEQLHHLSRSSIPVLNHRVG